jgi:hypothetical protein
LRRTELLQALACGAQARTDLQRLAEIGKRGIELPLLGQAVAAEAVRGRKLAAGFAFGIDDPLQAATFSSGGLVTLMQDCQLWSPSTDPWTDPWADAAGGCPSITAVLFVAGLHRRGS